MGCPTVRKVPKTDRGGDFPPLFYPPRPDRIPPLARSPRTSAGRGREKLDFFWLPVWLVFAAVWCLSASGQLSATFDEPVYLRHGLERWRTGDCRHLTKLGTMPLPVDVATLPLYLAERWRGFPFDVNDDLDELLPPARAANLFFLGLLLYYGLRAGRSLAGPWGGRLAVAFLACEPTVLAHAGLATTDIAITACLLALLYHYRAAREAGTPAGRFRRIVVPAFWFAATVLSKASGIVYGPLCLLAVELSRKRPEGQERSFCLRAMGGPLIELMAIMGMGLLLTCLYCGSSDGPARARLIARVEQLSDGPVRRLLSPIAEHAPLFNNAADGIWFQVRRGAQRQEGTFLLGKWHAGQWVWYYFPAALAIKLPLPLLVLPLLLAVRRPRSLTSWPCVAAGALLFFSVVCRVQIGVRFMLPLIALALVGLAAACAVTARRHAAIRFAAPLALVWMLVSSVAVWPHGLCYTNELWGGTERGYLCLSDSNYDWGQGARELCRWQREQGIARLDVWYFGSDPALRRLPLRWLHLENMPVHAPGGLLDLLDGRYLAVSTTALHGHPCHDCPAAVFLRGHRPVARTRTFLIYYISKAG